jgi:hypothetical protein
LRLKVILLICFILCSLEINAAGFSTFDYQAIKNENIKNIISPFLIKESAKNSLELSIRITKDKNKSIQNWDHLDKNQSIKIYILSTAADTKKIELYNEKNLPRHHITLSITPSLGTFTQSKVANSAINYTQFSPFALGVSYQHAPIGKKYSLSGSLYYSYLLSSSAKGYAASGAASSLAIPPELGGNAYGEYSLEKIRTAIYGGLDGEQFSSFNLDGIVYNNLIYIDRNNIFYATIGLAKFWGAKEDKILTKFAFSKSIFSSSTSINPDPLSKAQLIGYKLMFFVNYKITNRWSVHSLFKYHSFSGVNLLTTLRIGAGIGYNFF